MRKYLNFSVGDESKAKSTSSLSFSSSSASKSESDTALDDSKKAENSAMPALALSPADKFYYAALCTTLLPYSGRDASTSGGSINSITQLKSQLAKKDFSTCSDDEFGTYFILQLAMHLELSEEKQLVMLTFYRGGIEKNPELFAAPFVNMKAAEKEEAQKTHVVDADKATLCWMVLQDVLSTIISTGVYDARARVLLRKMADLFGMEWLMVEKYEDLLAVELTLKYAETDAEKEERLKREKARSVRKIALITAMSLGGGVIIGLTGGLAAPLIAASATAIIGSGGAVLAGTGGAALLGTLFGAAGAGLTGHKMNRRVGSIKEFSFKPLTPQERMHVVICITGWLKNKEDDFESVWESMGDVGERYALVWESQTLINLGESLSNLIKDQIVSFATKEIIKQTILAGLMTAVALPAALVSAASIIDNPWSVAQAKADECGILLASVLQKREQGCRPVTLIGYSLGARVIFKCLQELCSRKIPVKGIVENVYLFGAPVPGDKLSWEAVRSVVAGKFINGYCRTDWILKYLYRTTSAHLEVAGLAPLGVDTIDDIDLTDEVTGHLDYKANLTIILKKVGLICTDSNETDEVNLATSQTDNVIEIATEGSNSNLLLPIQTTHTGAEEIVKQSDE